MKINDERRTAWERDRIETMARFGTRALLVLMVLTVAMLAAACVHLVAPRNTADSLAYAEGQVQALARSCTTLNDERRITLEQAVRCRGASDQAFAAIDIGRTAARAGDITKADAQLQLVRGLLVELERITGGPK